jgi:ABC-type phosphate transport system substrate-binding protein
VVGRMSRAVAVALLALIAGPLAAQAADDRQAEQWAVAPGALLDLPGAWELSRGAGVVVAVIDTGTRLDHPDLAPNVWTNFDEVAGNGIDDDHNGYVDDVHGVDLTSTRAAQDLSDGNGHGTHVAGIIAAAANGRGVVGVAPRAQIMTVKALDASGSGVTSAVAEGIRYAAANGAKIINMSLGGDAPDPRVQEAIAAAAAANVLVVCSAGNSSRDIDQQPSYPVSVPLPNLVGVASTSPNEGRSLSGFSNFGRITVSLAAPGESVLSTSKDGGYAVMSGTSMAAPHVAGVAALMASIRPDLPAVDLRAALLQNALPSPLAVGSGYLYALGSVLSVASAASLQQGQRPEVRVLKAERVGGGRRSVTQAQVALLGASAAVSDYRVLIDRRQVSVVRKRPTPFTLRLKGRSGRSLRVEARDAHRRVLASTSHAIVAVKRGKRDIRSGGGVTSGAAPAPVGGTTSAAGAAGSAERGTISMSGSSTALPVVADLAYFYGRTHPSGPRFSLVGGGTAAGLTDVVRGIVDAGLVSRAPAAADPPGLVHTTFAVSGVCLVTNRANRLPGMSRATIQDIVAGRVTSWSQVPGATRADAIDPIALAPGTGARTVFGAVLLDPSTPIAYRPLTVTTASQVRDLVLARPGAWGYVDLAFTKGLNVAAYEGVPCTRDTVRAETYPATRPLAFVTRGAPRGATARFLRWVRTSPTAARVIDTRYVTAG